MTTFPDLKGKRDIRKKIQRAEQIGILEADEDEFYPNFLREDDSLNEAREAVENFRELVLSDDTETTFGLFARIHNKYDRKGVGGQMIRIFRRYACVDLPHELLKKQYSIKIIEKKYTDYLKDIDEIREIVESRPEVDEPMIALLAQHGNREERGYKLENDVAEKLRSIVPSLEWEGEGVGQDIHLENRLSGYDEETPVDMIGTDDNGNIQLVVFCSYRRGRGGSQSGDRGGSNADYAQNIEDFVAESEQDIKVLIVTDGPALIFDDVWNNHSKAETNSTIARVCTFKMINDRVSPEWIFSEEHIDSSSNGDESPSIEKSTLNDF